MRSQSSWLAGIISTIAILNQIFFLFCVRAGPICRLKEVTHMCKTCPTSTPHAHLLLPFYICYLSLFLKCIPYALESMLVTSTLTWLTSYMDQKFKMASSFHLSQLFQSFFLSVILPCTHFHLCNIILFKKKKNQILWQKQSISNILFVWLLYLLF